jgi:predicted metal-dependent peptidase
MSDTTLAEKSKVVTVTDPKVDARVRDKLITARVALLLKAPFFGNMATRFKILNADDWCPTAATDGRHFYYNSAFVDRLSLREVEFLFGHEVLHAIYDHMGRRGDREPRLWNIADDYCVNADLIEHKIGEKITKVGCLYDPKYKGMSAEEVYDLLYKNAEKIDIDKLAKQLLDEHLDGDEGDSEGDSNGDGNKEGNGRPRLTDAEKQQIRDEIKQAVITAAQTAGAGDLPGNVKRMVKDLTAPVMDWRELLQQQIQSTVKSDFTWMRPSRRSWHMDAVFPGMVPGQQIDVVVAIDMSGSISDEDSKIFLSEVKGIMESYDEYKIHVLCWDTDTYNPQDFTSDNMEDIASYQPMGGGGTDPHCVWEYLQDKGMEPKKLIMFTDYCFFGWEPDRVRDYCETVWIIKNNRDAEPEFGVWANYDEVAK